jgi:hypothetical protein
MEDRKAAACARQDQKRDKDQICQPQAQMIASRIPLPVFPAGYTQQVIRMQLADMKGHLHNAMGDKEAENSMGSRRLAAQRMQHPEKQATEGSWSAQTAAMWQYVAATDRRCPTGCGSERTMCQTKL